jgi:threonine dehydratase
MNPIQIYQAAQQAQERLRPHIKNTPLEHSAIWSSRYGANVYFKLENLQFTASFKARGAFNKILTLEPNVLARGLVAASSGNHGSALAFAAQKLGVQVRVFVPEHASPAKVSAIKAYGATIEYYGLDGLETELQARAFALQHNQHYCSPYNDYDVIAGQATLALEMLESNPNLSAIFLTVGGGGLIAGVAAAIKAVQPNIRIIGCQPSNDAAMMQAVQAGKIIAIEAQPTISDGSAGGIEPEALTFPICQTCVDEWVTVSEAEIKTAMRDYLETHYQLLEGAAGVALAAFQKTATQYQNQDIAVVICGAKISLKTLQQVLETP